VNDKDFLTTLSLLKNKDPKIYSCSAKFYASEGQCSVYDKHSHASIIDSCKNLYSVCMCTPQHVVHGHCTCR